MLKALFFDMDGTLIDSDHLVETIYDLLTTKYPPDIPLSKIPKQDLFAKSYIEVIEILYQQYDDRYLEEVKSLHQMLQDKHLKLFEGTHEMLQSIQRYPVYLFLVTSELRDIATKELKKLSIYDMFDDIITATDLMHQKPNPEGLLKLLTRYDLNPSECLFIGDQKTDAMAGQQAGIRTALMGWNPKHRDEIAHHFDVQFSNWKDVVHYIDNSMSVFHLKIDSDEIRIIQFTDLHLMDDANDLLTFEGIQKSVKSLNPDFIVLTGDQTMSNQSEMLYHKLVKLMDDFGIPWTLIFGNHDTDHGVLYTTLISAMKGSKHLIFSPGPEELGFSNFTILIQNQKNQMRYQLIFMDTHIDQYYQIDQALKWGYGSISKAQMIWYEQMVSLSPTTNSMVFLHIPIPEFRLVQPSDRHLYQGDYLENPSTPPYDFGFFKQILQLKHSVALFAGHDHYNDYQFNHQGIMLAYGRVSGHYDYGPSGFPKGLRWIEIQKDNTFQTKIILYQDIKEKQ
jgi:HAD superfamily hydrolase (TIGR01549 family)